jgi:DNA (cytosine-5)-methyltransferase 1
MSAACVILAVGEVSPVRIGSLFSGYGGLDMAVSSVLGGSVAWHVEFDKAPSRILAHHYPDVPNYGDVTAVDFTTIEPVDVLTGGYPCQPFSHAGLRKGTDDDRHLWPHVLRAIREMGPRLAILENVRGHISLGFDVVLADLASLGWSARWGVIRASDAGAPHQRARLFIVAYPDDRALLRRLQPRMGARHDPAGCGQGDCGCASGTSDSAADASGERHGPGKDGRGLGRLDGQDAGSPRQRQRARKVAGDRGPAATADASGSGAWSDYAGLRQDRIGGGDRAATNWGDYGPAIARWEHVIGRTAPAPTEPGRTGNPRLAPRFVEWMMGLPDGHVTDPAIGISRNDQLKALGNGVVPQQAALALDVLLKGTPYDIRQGLAAV